MTKLVAAYGSVMAVEEGIFEPDSPLGREGSSVRHLLVDASRVGTNRLEPEREPGERRIYSIAGFEILADAVADESGMSFPSIFARGAEVAGDGRHRSLRLPGPREYLYSQPHDRIRAGGAEPDAAASHERR